MRPRGLGVATGHSGHPASPRPASSGGAVRAAARLESGNESKWAVNCKGTRTHGARRVARDGIDVTATTCSRSWTSPQLIRDPQLRDGRYYEYDPERPGQPCCPGAPFRPRESIADERGLAVTTFQGLTSDGHREAIDPWHANRSFTIQRRHRTVRFSRRRTRNSCSKARTRPMKRLLRLTIGLFNNTQDAVLSGNQENAQVQVLLGAKVSFLAEGDFKLASRRIISTRKLNGALTGSAFNAKREPCDDDALLHAAGRRMVGHHVQHLRLHYGQSLTFSAAPRVSLAQLTSEGVPVVAGKVVDAFGAPVAGAEVDVTVAGVTAQKLRGRTLSDGTFAFINYDQAGPVTATSPGGSVSLSAIPGARMPS